MNKLGFAIDISHSGDNTSMDVIKHSTKPIFMTHCGSREVWPTNRMKPDAVIKAMAERGGVIGLEAAPHTTLSEAHPAHSLESVMDHFTHLVDVVGIDHVAFGPDTLFGDHVGLHDAFSSNLWIGQAHGMVQVREAALRRRPGEPGRVLLQHRRLARPAPTTPTARSPPSSAATSSAFSRKCRV